MVCPIYLDPSSRDIIYDIKNVTNTYDGRMMGHHWLMTEEGLKCTDCAWIEEDEEEERTEQRLLEEAERLEEEAIELQRKAEELRDAQNELRDLEL